MTKTATPDSDVTRLQEELADLRESLTLLRSQMIQLLPWIAVDGVRRCVMCNAIWMHEPHNPECLWADQ
jgi:hypothetical protein